jgi:uncharacterized membrane protein
LRSDNAGTIWRTLGLGAIAGVRSMAAPAILSRSSVEDRIGSLEGTPFAMLGSPMVSTALQLLEIGEMIGDKTPIIPSRTSLLPLLGRAAIAALGAVSAMAAAHAAERLRMQVTQRLGVSNVAAGLLEDGIVLLGGPRLVR